MNYLQPFFWDLLKKVEKRAVIRLSFLIQFPIFHSNLFSFIFLKKLVMEEARIWKRLAIEWMN